MAYLVSNIPYFKVWVRKEFTHNHRKYHGEYIHGLATAITSIPDRCLSFQVIFTGCEDEENRLENPHGGAMWARMPITALVADEPLDTFPPPIQTHLAQPWDCSARNFEVIKFDRTNGPWEGCIVALPNNRVRVTSPAMWVTGKGAPDFIPSQWTHSAEEHDSYMDWETTFNNLYADEKDS
jgi:hypothetical protein